jgi:CelD/BcsL family acetyltransferase involved in cellulose biosynthesis
VNQFVAASESSWESDYKPRRMAGPLRIEVQPDLDLAPDDEATLAALVAQRPGVGIFLSKPWLSGFFADPPPGAELALVLLREGRTLRGLVPIAVHPTRSHMRVTLLGGGVGSDRVDLLAARGFEAVISDAFFFWLGEMFGPRGVLLELRNVPANSSLWGAIHRAGAERTLPLVLQPREVYTHPYLALKAAESSTLCDAPSTECLRSVQKHRRRLERRGPLKIELLDELAPVSEAFEILTRFLHPERSAHAKGSALTDPRAVRFHRHVLPMLLYAGHLRMLRVSSGDRTVAISYAIASGSWWGHYQTGYDREWAGRLQLGHVTLAAAIECASQEKATEFDFLKGAERVKYIWPVRERTTLDADVFSEGSAVQFARATRASRDAAAALAKSARHLFFM